MAIGKKAAPAPKKTVSLRFSDMSQGLLDDFSGEITGADFRVHQYKEGSPEALVMALTVTTEEGNEHTEFYSLGKTALENFRPSKDGTEPIDEEGDIEDMRGNFIVPISDRARLSGSTAFGVFMKEAEKEEFGIEVSDNIGSIIGTYAHFNRLEQPPLKGIIQTQEQKDKGPWKVLCITDIPKREKGAATKVKAAVKATEKAAPVEENDDDELRASLSEAIVEALGTAKNGVLSKVKIANIAIKLSDDKNEKKALVALAGDNDFLGGIEGASFDEDEGTLSAE